MRGGAHWGRCRAGRLPPLPLVGRAGESHRSSGPGQEPHRALPGHCTRHSRPVTQPVISILYWVKHGELGRMQTANSSTNLIMGCDRNAWFWLILYGYYIVTSRTKTSALYCLVRRRQWRCCIRISHRAACYRSNPCQSPDSAWETKAALTHSPCLLRQRLYNNCIFAIWSSVASVFSISRLYIILCTQRI